MSVRVALPETPRSEGSRRREDLHQIYALPLKSGEPLPPIPPSGISWRAAPPLIAAMRTIPQRAFMSADPRVYAYQSEQIAATGSRVRTNS